MAYGLSSDNDMQLPVYLVSACLMGLRTRYDGTTKTNQSCLEKWKESLLIPVCPEQLGGLSTPRAAADLVGGDGDDVLVGRARVVNREGGDVTEQFLLGANQVLLIASCYPAVAGAILKARSPSCGVSPVLGVTAALLKSRGIAIIEF